jgi:hypothetical protein
MKKIHIFQLLVLIILFFSTIYNIFYNNFNYYKDYQERDYFSMLEKFSETPKFIDPKLLEITKSTSQEIIDKELKSITKDYDKIYPKDEEFKKPEPTDKVFMCNQESKTQQLEEIKKSGKKSPCNMSIQEKYMFSCKQPKPFPLGEQYSDMDLLEDPSKFYKELQRPVIGLMDEFEFLGANMPEYSNYANTTQIGNIKLDINKVHPVPQNFTFKNSPAFDFI